MAHSSHHHHSSGNRTLPQYADTSKLGEIDELEAIGVLSRTHLDDHTNSLSYNPYDHLNTLGSRLHTAISMEEFEARHHSTHINHSPTGHSNHPRCTCRPKHGSGGSHHRIGQVAAESHGHSSSPHGVVDQRQHLNTQYADHSQYATMPHVPSPAHPRCTCGPSHSMSFSPDNRNAAQSYNMTSSTPSNPLSLQLGHGMHSPAGAATPPPDFGDIKAALERGESQMTVYNPEEIYTSMAPRTNCLEIRQNLIGSSFKRDLETLDEIEFEMYNEQLRSFHESRRHDVTVGGKSFMY